MSAPLYKHLVLIGGGHAHVFVLRRLAMQPQPGLKVTLICRDTHTPYSGMLPGYIAGHYRYDDIHIDLARLAARAGIAFVSASVTGLDAKRQQVHITGRPPIPYDVVSINTGSTPDLDSVPGARQYALPVKPISQFLQRFQAFEIQLAHQTAPQKLVCVGTGAGGIELMLALRHRFRDRKDLEYHLLGRAPEVLPASPKAMRRAMARQLDRFGITCHLGKGALGVTQTHLECDDGSKLAYDQLLWVTRARPAAWFQDTGLALTDQGFLAIEDDLRVTGQAAVFAAGDCATMVHQPREKAGVFAVRQGPVLADNILRALKGQGLKQHKAQGSYLSLIALGPKEALGSKGALLVGGQLMGSKWVWQWKDRIDRSFMQRFSDLPPMEVHDGVDPGLKRGAALALSQPLCVGCGGKVGRTSLSRALAQQGLSADAQDAALLPNSDWLQSVDLVTAPISDLYQAGAVMAAHALSDIYAEGAQPKAALVLAMLRRQAPRLLEGDLQALIAGARSVLEPAGTMIIGGHSLEGEQAAMGLAVSGLIEEGSQRWHKAGAKPGDVLLLSKPLGTGLLLAGLMSGHTKGRWLDAAIQRMAESHAEVTPLLQALQPSAVTDVTGFGLLGHLSEILLQSGCGAQLNLQALPAYEGALWLAEQGVRARLFTDNADGFGIYERNPRQVLACDPQTSGGLLAAVPAERWAAATPEQRAKLVPIGLVCPADQVAEGLVTWDAGG